MTASGGRQSGVVCRHRRRSIPWLLARRRDSPCPEILRHWSISTRVELTGCLSRFAASEHHRSPDSGSPVTFKYRMPVLHHYVAAVLFCQVSRAPRVRKFSADFLLCM
jgi:hypothetical protein